MEPPLHSSETRFLPPLQEQKPGCRCIQQEQTQMKRAPVQLLSAPRELVPAAPRDRYFQCICENALNSRLTYVSMMAPGSAVKGYWSSGEPTGKRGVPLPVGLQVYVSRSSAASGIDELLNLLTEEILSQPHFARCHARH